MSQHTWPSYKNKRTQKNCKISAVYSTLNEAVVKESLKISRKS